MQSCWVLYTSFAMPMVGSKDDELIQNDDFGLRGFTEMVQNNYGDADDQKASTELEQSEDGQLIGADGLVDLERLRIRESESRAEAVREEEATESDIALQHAVAQFFTQQYNEQAQAHAVGVGAAAAAAAHAAAAAANGGGGSE